MVNAGDLLKENTSPLNQCKKIFPNKKQKLNLLE